MKSADFFSLSFPFVNASDRTVSSGHPIKNFSNSIEIALRKIELKEELKLFLLSLSITRNRLPTQVTLEQFLYRLISLREAAERNKTSRILQLHTIMEYRMHMERALCARKRNSYDKLQF